MSVIKFYRRKELMGTTGKSSSTIERDIKAGLLEKPVKIGVRAVAWPETAVEAYQKRLIERHQMTPSIPAPTGRKGRKRKIQVFDQIA